MMNRLIELSKPLISEEENQAVQEVLCSGQLSSGPRVKAFEEAFAAFVGCQYAVATSNGTAALSVALQAAGVTSGDKVITTSFSFIATANAIVHAGGIPIFVDIDPETYNISPTAIKEALREHPDARALLIVHLYGHACDMQAIMNLVRSKGLILVEDCAQAHGATYAGQPVGSFGHAAAFSFYATKNMTTGEGGMVTTSLAAVAERARKLINHGRVEQYLHDEIGYNYRMTDLAAAIGLVQLRRLPEFNRKRQANAAYLSSRLAGVPYLRTPRTVPPAAHVYHQYTIRAENRDGLQEWLQKRGIRCAVVYPTPLPIQPVYKDLLGSARFPVAEQAAAGVLSIPVHPALSVSDLDYVVEAIQEFYDPVPWKCSQASSCFLFKGGL